jgi:hypothetical protein
MGSNGLLSTIGARIRLARRAIIAPPVIVVALATMLTVPSRAEILWYNGDFESNSFGVLNGIDMTFEGQFPNPGRASVYDNFDVPPTGGGWHVDAVWSNNLMTFTGVTQATWSIRTDLSSGDGGTIVAAGISPVTQTPTGRGVLEFEEFTILISGLSIQLPPGTYWLSVTPHGFGGAEASLNSVTRGLNGLGRPPSGDAVSFLDSDVLNADFTPLDEIFFPAPDFSMGVAGSVLVSQLIPEPASIVLTALGLAALAWARLAKRSRRLGYSQPSHRPAAR